jgi:hypothetical protein
LASACCTASSASALRCESHRAAVPCTNMPAAHSTAHHNTHALYSARVESM